MIDLAKKVITRLELEVESTLNKEVARIVLTIFQ